MKYETWDMKYMKKIYKLANDYSIYLILALATVLRLRQLGVRDFWYDEAFTGIAVKESWSGMLGMIMKDVHPPLYYITLKLFSVPFDYSVVGIRLFSAIFGILCVFAVYLFAKELFGKRAALFASLIAALSPFAIQYSQEGRMYSMFAFFILMAGYFLVKSLRATEFTSYRVNRYSILFGLFLGLSALTHYMGIFFAPIFYLVYVVWNFNKGDILSSDLRFTIYDLRKLFVTILPTKQIILGFFVSVLVFLPWISNFINHVVKNATSNSLDWIRPANFGDISVNIQMFIFGTPLGEMSSGMPGPNEFYGIADISMWVAITIFFTSIIIYLLYPRPSILSSSGRVATATRARGSKVMESRHLDSRLRGNDKRGGSDNKKIEIVTVILLSIGFMMLIWLLGFFGKYYFVARYLLPAGYFIFALIGVWLSRIRLPYSALAVTFYIVLLFLTVPLGYSEGWNEFTNNMDKYKNSDFYILNSFDYVIAKYYLGADRLTLYNVDWPPYNPDYWAAIGSSLKRTENFEDLRNDKNALIISNTQLGGQDNVNFDPAGLELISQYKNILIYKFK